jgi:hypothetical protein
MRNWHFAVKLHRFGLVVGSAVGAAKTRCAMLLHLPPMPGHGGAPRVKNVPPRVDYGAERRAITLDTSYRVMLPSGAHKTYGLFTDL